VLERGTPPDAVYAFKHALVRDVAHGSLLRNARQQLHAQIAKALEAQLPELMETRPELFAQHYAEAGLIEQSVAYWSKAGRSSAHCSPMAEAAAQYQKWRDQLAPLPETPERQRQELQLHSAVGAVWQILRGAGGGNRSGLCTRTRVVGATRFPRGISRSIVWTVSLCLTEANWIWLSASTRICCT